MSTNLFIMQRDNPHHSLAIRVLLATVIGFTIPIALYLVLVVIWESEQLTTERIAHIEAISHHRAMRFAQVISKDITANHNVRKNAQKIFAHLRQEHIDTKNKHFRVDLSLLSPNNRIIASTNPALSARTIQLSASHHFTDDDTIGTVSPIPKSTLRVMASLHRNELKQLRNQNIIRSISLLSIITVVSACITWLMVRTLAYPLHHLKQTMLGITAGRLHARFQQQRFGFEINQLGQSFNDCLDTIKETHRLATKARVEQETLAAELALGRDIQQQLLPRAHPDSTDIAVASLYLPAKEVSGDFYDVVRRDQTNIIVTIADGAGKGISACFYSLCLRSLLRSAYYSQYSSLSHMLARAHQLFLLDVKGSSHFVTALCVHYDAQTNCIHYCNAGHPAGFLFKADGSQCQRLDRNRGLPIGVTNTQTFNTGQYPVSPGDTLVLFTDGITEAQNEQDHLLGESQFLAWLQHALADTSNLPSAQSLCDTVRHRLRRYQGEAAQFDDITLVVTRFL